MIAQVTDCAESIGAVRMRRPLSRRSSWKELTARAMLPVERQLLPATGGAGAHDRLADLRRSIAVLEGRAVRRDVAVVGDRAEEVMHLVHEGVSPPDDVARRPPEVHEGMVRLCHEHGPEAARPFLAVEEDLQLVHALHVEVERAARAVDLPLERVATSECQTCRLDRPDGAGLELDGGLDC